MEAEANAGSPPKEPEVKAPEPEVKVEPAASPAAKIPAEVPKKEPEIKEVEQKAEEVHKELPENDQQEVSKEEEKHTAKGPERREDYVMPTSFEVEIHLEDNQVTDRITKDRSG